MNMDLSPYEISSLVRGVIYLWVGANSFSTAQLYRDGYAIARKNSGLIRALMNILYWNSVVFLMLSFAAFTVAFKFPALNRWVLTSLPVVAVPMGFLLIRFRKESITEQEGGK